MHPAVIIIAMVNGMIGGLILVLPILAAEGGSILSGIIIVVTGFFSLYSCFLCLLHLGNHSDLDKAILQHFNGSKFVKISYDLLVFTNLVFLLLLYFNLIVQQWEGLLPKNVANPICNIFALIFLTAALNYFHFGAQLLGYGIISIIGYCIFLVWLIATAPSGDNTVPLFGDGAINLAASMGQAFAIQTFFIPVLRELPDSRVYIRYTTIAYCIGTSVYIYIAYTGSFGIVNRTVEVNPLQTVEDYFKNDTWEVAVVEVIYLIHLYSAFGEFLLVAKKRFFGAFNLVQSKQGNMLKISEGVFVVVIVGISALVFFLNVTIGVLIEINGAIIGFFFIYLLPAVMHAKCLYFSSQPGIEGTSTVRQQLTELKDIDHMKGDKDPAINTDQLQKKLSELPENLVIRKNTAQGETGPGKEQQALEGEQVIVGPCPAKRPKFYLMVLDIISLVGMVGLGAFIMVDGFISVIQG